MTNNPLNTDATAQSLLAKTALNKLRTSDHALGRPLALCLMFENAKDQLLAASVFELAVALDAALNTPSETLLAAIRIQWWTDSLVSKADQHVPLVSRLQSQYQLRIDLLPQLRKLINEWQAACHDENRDSVAGWATAWRLVALHLGYRTGADQAAMIGRDLYYATRGEGFEERSVNIDIDIKSLRRNGRKAGRSWLYLAACLHKKLKSIENPDLESTKIRLQTGLDDPVLVWKILGWHIFGPPR